MLELKLSAALSYSFLWFQNIYQSAGRCRYYADIPQKKPSRPYRSADHWLFQFRWFAVSFRTI